VPMTTPEPSSGPSHDTSQGPGPHDAGHDDASTIARTLDIVGDRWSFMILRAAFRGIHRFEVFRAELGIARPVLSDRLRKLVDAGIMERRRYQERPERYEYRLTRMGLELSPALVALMRWGDKYLTGPEGPPTVLVHAPCGTPLEQRFWCDTCEQTFGPTAIRGVPG
jgi:DNA-binding HxlR family transcriptional regulator